jgi:hypothetical protein
MPMLRFHRRAMGAAVGVAAGIGIPALAGAETAFCGVGAGTASELMSRVGAMPGIREVHRDRDFVAYQDPASSTVYTFTVKGQPAHPAAVCRKPVQKGDSLEIEMAIVCEGPERHCTQLDGDFKLLNAKMQADINNQIQAGKR